MLSVVMAHKDDRLKGELPTHMDAEAIFSGSPVWIISDVHLGAPQCRLDELQAFLDALPDKNGLILNGDTLERGFKPDRAPSGHLEMLHRLKAESLRRPVVWIRGNNDSQPEPLAGETFIFADFVRFGQRLHVEHGDRFDRLRAPFKPLLYAIKAFYDRISGGRSAHITAWASRLPCVFRLLTWQLSRQAAAYARAHGVEAIACGHSHDDTERIVKGIRYLNTGCWAGTGACAVRVEEESITVHQVLKVKAHNRLK